MTNAERDALAAEVNRQITYLIPFMNDILAARNADRPITPLLQRVELWVNDLGRIRILAQNMAGADRKAEWVLGPTEEHCSTCSFYAGKVYRRSVWTKWLEPYNLMPRTKGPGKECEGWQCKCDLVDTDKPVTPGRPPIWKPSRKSVDGKIIIHGRHEIPHRSHQTQAS